ncbi:Maf family protein [Marinilabilia rubra]|uniref:dTTP/UTP pyrophosphatase n=1 Tax=Marinilabilia rubra TaxID=2162893 RepID=A0A2U2B534_9BACT|nr:Maf family protein [Marinilabilia rubra]PWD98188.1 septum formation protein Maf [Marinilabilia rubra]
MFLKNLDKYTITLASGSPRRHDLLKKAGIHFNIGTGKDVPEIIPEKIHVDDVPLYLARLKSNAWQDLWEQKSQLVITADTIVALDNQVIGKPEDRDDAIEMLENLSGRSHRVITGVIARTSAEEKAFTDITTVHFKPLSREQIEYYVDHFEPFDKAGSYGIQEWIGITGINRIEGSYFNVMGLPVSRLVDELATIDR